MKDNFIGNKLKEISEEYESWCRNIALDALCGKYDYIKSEDWWKEKIKQSLTDYHNHIVESLNRSIDGCDWVDIEDGKGRYVNERQLARNIIENIGILQDTNSKE